MPTLGIPRTHAVAPTLNLDSYFAITGGGEFSPQSVSYFGHAITIDLPTGNLSVTATDLHRRYYGLPYGVTRLYDIQEEFMRLDFARTHANIEPRFAHFGNWHSDQEVRVEDAWHATKGEIHVAGNDTVSGLYQRDGTGFSRKRLTQAHISRVLGEYGIPKRTLDALDWRHEPQDFLLRTTQGGFRIATGRYSRRSLLDGPIAEIWVFDPIRGVSVYLTSNYARNQRAGLVRELAEHVLVAKVIDPLGHVMVYGPDAANPDRPAMKLCDGDGRVLTYLFDHTTDYQDPTYLNGIVRQRMVSETRFEPAPDETTFSYGYSNADLLETVEHDQENGKHTVHYHYNASGILEAIENTDGAQLSLHYAEDRYDCDDRLNPRLKIARISGPNGNELIYNYDSRNKRVVCELVDNGVVVSAVAYTYVQDKEGTKRRYVTSEEVIVRNGYMLSSGGTLSPRGASTSQITKSYIEYTSDGRFNPHQMADAAGRKTTYSYNDFNQVTEMIEPDGRTTKYQYDIPDAPDTANPRRYDLIEQLSSEIIQRRSVRSGGVIIQTTTETITESYTSKRYDAQTSAFPSLDQYHSTHRVTSYTDGEGRTTLYEYDDSPNYSSVEPTKVTSPSDRVSKARYGPHGELEQLTDPAGRVHGYSYDNQGRIERYADPWGHDLTLEYYDGTDLVRVYIDRRGNTIRVQRNALGQMTSRTDPAGDTTHYSYYPNGRLQTIIRDRPAAQQDPNVPNAVTVARIGLTVTYRYDARGDVVQYTNEAGLEIRFQRDERGRVFERSLSASLSPEVKVAYDVTDHAIGSEDQLGRTTLLTYRSDSGWLDTIQYPSWNDDQTVRAGRTVRYLEYNHSGQALAIEDSDLTGTKRTRIGYDRTGLEMFRRRGSEFDIVFQYNADGDQQQIVDQTGAINATMRYTKNGDPREVNDVTSLDAAAVWEYLYKADINGSTVEGRLFGRVVPAIGLTSTFRYDENGLPTLVGHTWDRPAAPIETTVITYRPDNNIASISGTLAEIYRHDAQKQLIFESNGNLSSDYDKVGNRLYRSDRSVIPTPAHAQYSDRNELARSGDQSRTYTYQGGACSTVSEVGQVACFWFDGEQRLRVFKRQSETIRYTYDYGGRLVERKYEEGSNPTIVTTFEYIGTHPVMITQGSSRIVLLWGPNGEVLRAVSNSPIGGGTFPNSLFVTIGGLGRMVNWMDANRNVVRSHTYDAWGVQTNAAVDGSMLVDYIGFRGGIYDPGTKLTLYGARWYDPSIGRWISEDALERIDPDPGSGELGNLFRYARNNPLRYWDPAGLKPRNYFWIYLTVGGPDDWHGHIGIILPNKNGTVTKYSMAAENVNSPNRRDYEYLWWMHKAKVQRPRTFKSISRASRGVKDIVKIHSEHVEEIRKAIDEYIKDEPYYHLLTNNCADFVNDVANAAPDVALFDRPIPIDYFENVKYDLGYPRERLLTPYLF